MRERAERWGGTLTVQPGHAAGTVVRLAVPLPGELPLIPAELPLIPGAATGATGSAR